MPTYQLFATTPKAMETILTDELQALGVNNIKATLAGVAFQGNLETAYRACLWSRTANRILLVLSSFEVKTQEELYNGVQKIDWFEHINPEDSFAVSFSAKNSAAINNTHFGALKVKDAIVDQMRARFQTRPSINTEQPNIRINVYLNGENAQLSLDLSGESLHRRGYRDVSIKAPMKENLAAAMLLRSGWPQIAKQQGSLIDPMCGSGTLLLEGAMIAADYAPGLLRDYFGFIGWKKHDAQCWKKLRAEAEQRKKIGLEKLPVIVGFDQNRHTVNTALAHIANAGLQNKIHVERRDIEDAEPAESWKPGLLICNPPYGERLGDEQETAELYKKFGESLKAHFIGWKAAMIISNPELGFRLGLRSQKPITLFNGALECKLLRLDIEESNFFIPKAKTQEERITQAIETGKIQEQRIAQATETSTTQQPETIRADTLAGQDVSELGAEMFANRLKKNLKKLSHWAKQNRITCYRVYDADLPEYAVAVDIYQGDQTWINVQEYEPPKSIDQHKADQRLAGLLAEIPRVLGVNREQVFLKIRRKQKSTDQYEKHDDQGRFHIIEEGGCKLLVNFEDYLDTGLFLDHRPIRMLIQKQAKDKSFLNLFAYTGSATVHAAMGGAKSTTTVDMSNTYINWAKKNMALNANEGAHEFIQADCLEWLAAEAQLANRHYDLIFLDPPTFSNSKRMDAVFDIQNDHVQLINNAISLLSPGGVLYFSTNFRRFKIDKQALSDLIVEDISAATIPEDFARNPKIHYCWRIQE
ncbi:bifunctional 23S rRNA (guanine(2069)-N(7))-methyltransferase RlmK/23S rRNA (guanine(2445)-N(2))-methyltransferase RlmL [Methylobacter sp.]|uniref:bifunctional 23S rRNA (guanine(2069)-N(7))-methyltransferase RlmK/23S rRNA (guanine(2445)-N(2))-methyltransferase RlmL n=1 Tax=Methylobacter sp. TaxID=2051955 RepID=UPI0024886597|nr:bifunctional 23S rRNA (guanine(2069)-N(7))-methyltransferase RlmK/23S rRNA (guanine(2445)-N(2))-methyltransferase RlmL [Methylobacter sp.]MDI1279551.1 bifunctional 23S rRNA (guanine(2069)-N(7))-methyltransferase RlmK/23S rRNA (guanine(2445)-N(2))-methyltransferase RlmL [Methylobacter sp.]MDI1360289.1 bifunctional 23S rRNA (guanine(2069)-N(7))-methyltransferase RlmK/23S rRNA (guanine(2445)-N(2))-methyltransferase RlmL [Methylobacter sp.]